MKKMDAVLYLMLEHFSKILANEEVARKIMNGKDGNLLFDAVLYFNDKKIYFITLILLKFPRSTKGQLLCCIKRKV